MLGPRDQGNQFRQQNRFVHITGIGPPQAVPEPGALAHVLAHQQIVGGAWMGMSHAIWETTEPYYPSREHGPEDFNSYLMPGPGDLAPHHISVLERPAPDGPYGGKGPGEMCANPVLPAVVNAVYDAIGVRIDDLPVTPEKVLRGLKAQGGAKPRRML